MFRSRPRGEHSLVRWAIPQLHDIDSLSKMVDPSLNGAYPVKSLSRFADIISRCVQVIFFNPSSIFQLYLASPILFLFLKHKFWGIFLEQHLLPL